MKTIIFLVAVAAGGYYMYTNGWPGEQRIRMAADGATLEIVTEQGRARYDVGEEIRDTYLLWGAREGCQDPRGTCAALTALSYQAALGFARVYPDFHRCASPGARQAQESLRSLQLLLPDAKTQALMREIADDHARRERDSGDRLCVTLVAKEVEFVEADLGGATLRAADVPRPPSNAIQQRFLLVQSIEPHECPPLR